MDFNPINEVENSNCAVVELRDSDGESGRVGAKPSLGQRGSRKGKLICTGPVGLPVHWEKAV